MWRRDRDSNPGYPQRHNGFRDRPVRPLRHLSAGASVFSRGAIIKANAPGIQSEFSCKVQKTHPPDRILPFRALPPRILARAVTLLCKAGDSAANLWEPAAHARAAIKRGSHETHSRFFHCHGVPSPDTFHPLRQREIGRRWCSA